MKPFRIVWVILLVICFAGSAGAQIRINDKFKGAKNTRKKNTKRAEDRKKEEKPHWIFGIGWNAVDDNSKPFKKLFDFRKSWNIRPFPTQLTAEKNGNGGGMTWGGMFNFNIYKPGKIINGAENNGAFLFFSIDLFGKHHFKHDIDLKPWFDPYFFFGAGYTLRFKAPYRNTIMLDAGFGSNFWIYEWLGINVQSLAKFGMRSPFFRSGSNYLQHSVGLLYKIRYDKRKKYPFIKPRYPWVHRDKLGNERG